MNRISKIIPLIIILLMIFVLFLFCYAKSIVLITEKNLNNVYLFYEKGNNFDLTKMEDEKIIQIISNICLKEDSDFLKLMCVNDIIISNFNYISDENLDLIRKPTETLSNGGDCDDWATLYKSIFNVMGYSAYFIYPKNHIYTKVKLENKNICFDQGKWWDCD